MSGDLQYLQAAATFSRGGLFTDPIQLQKHALPVYVEVHVKEDYSIFHFLHPKPKNNKRTLCKSSLHHSVGENWPTIYIIGPPTNSSQPQTFPSKEPVDNSHSVVLNSLCKSGLNIPIKQTMYLSSQMNVSLTPLEGFQINQNPVATTRSSYMLKNKLYRFGILQM